MGLESFFSIGSSAIESAQNTFTNRTSEIDSFGRALDVYRDGLASPLAAVENVTLPRTNVLVFYGHGGIGKSRLSQELEGRYRAASGGAERLVYRLDFDAGSSTDHESVILGLRAVLGTHRPAWPAFDLAFSVYWERAHPGTPMSSALNESTMLRRMSGGSDVGSQIQSAVEGLLGAPGGVLGIFTSGARMIGKSIRERVAERRVVAACPFFEPIVDEPDPIAMRTYLPVLLAWDLAQRQQSAGKDGPVELVVFFDTWERVQAADGYRGDTEDLLSRMAYLMPNALFVVTGRNQLRWADEESRARMQWAGPDRWPLLDDGATHDPRQHLVGALSEQDADRFLVLRLRSAEQPLIPPDVREVIVGAAGGVPLYLDLAAVRYAQMIAQGRVPTAADVSQTFPELVLRIMRDLNHDQRSLLRLASLVGRFDADLLLAGSPGLSDSALAQFVRRSIVRTHADEFLPYSVHELLRAAVRDADVAEDQWSEREWRAAAARLTGQIRQRVEPELRASGSVDQAHLAGYLVEAFRLAACLGEVQPWVWQLAGRLHSLGAMDALASTRAATPDDGGPVAVAARALAAVAGRREAGPARTRDILAPVVDRGDLDDAGEEYVGYWLAWMLDETGETDEALRLRRRLVDRGGHLAPYLKHALARAAWVRGDLRAALAFDFDESDPLQRFWRTGIHGRAAWISGRFDAADELYRQRIQEAEAIGAPELLAHALRTRAELLCFTAPADQSAALEAVQLYQTLGVPVSRAETLAALETARCDVQPLDTTLSNLDALSQVLGRAPHHRVARVFAAAVHGDRATATAARDGLLSTGEGASYAYWRHITGWWLGAAGQADASQVDWLDGVDAARERWTDVLQRRRIPG